MDASRLKPFMPASAPRTTTPAPWMHRLEASLTYGASETRPVTLPENSFVWVNTGDPLPENYDCVVMVEDVIETDQGVQLLAPPHLAARAPDGEDIAAGDMVVPVSLCSVLPP